MYRIGVDLGGTNIAVGVIDENLKIILHYYNNPILAEILEEFSGYEGLGFIEIKNEVFQISVCI